LPRHLRSVSSAPSVRRRRKHLNIRLGAVKFTNSTWLMHLGAPSEHELHQKHGASSNRLPDVFSVSTTSTGGGHSARATPTSTPLNYYIVYYASFP
jgi:hypothetical protein